MPPATGTTTVSTRQGRAGASVLEDSRRSVRSRPLRIGLLNLMPEPGFAAAHQQFARLLAGSPRRGPIELRGYILPGASRPDAARSLAYADGTTLFTAQLDALVVTGTEPRSYRLEAETYWEPLAQTLLWAQAAVPSVLLSCLASHAALLALDGIPRFRQTTKCSGVFRQTVLRAHPLGGGLPRSVALPHSRWNDVPPTTLETHGYELVLLSEGGGWTLAHRSAHGRDLVLLQGHPEYLPTTLLREYRRDVRRFLDGSSATYPEVPTCYLDADGVGLCERFRAEYEGRRSNAPSPPFPFDAVAAHIIPSWERTAAHLFANWVSDARRRVHADTVAGEQVSHAG